MGLIGVKTSSFSLYLHTYNYNAARGKIGPSAIDALKAFDSVFGNDYILIPIFQRHINSNKSKFVSNKMINAEQHEAFLARALIGEFMFFIVELSHRKKGIKVVLFSLLTLFQFHR